MEKGTTGGEKSMTMIVPEKSHVDALKATYELIGPLYEVLVEDDGKVLQGSNRLATGVDWPKKTVKVESNLQRLLIRLLGNVQRQPKEEEVKYLLNKIAEDLVVTKKIVEAEASEEVCRMLCPRIYTEHHVRSLLEAKYKVKYRSEAGRKGGLQKAQNFATTSLAKGDLFADSGEINEGEHATEVMEEAEEEAEETKTTLDDLSKKSDDSPAYPYPDCKCSTCNHKGDCY